MTKIITGNDQEPNDFAIMAVYSSSFLLIFLYGIVFVGSYTLPDWCSLLSHELAVKYSVCLDSSTSSTGKTLPLDSCEYGSCDTHQTLSPDLFEGDMVGVDPKEVVTSNKGDKENNAVRDESKRWTDGIVPFTISSAFDDSDKIKILIANAMQVFHNRTCVRFVPRTSGHSDYVHIVPPTNLKQGVCSSYVGKARGQQNLVINEKMCAKSGVVQHELMHAIGFYHEQSRTDRDSYVDINLANIDPRNLKQFQAYTDVEVTNFNLAYDFGSIMHYPWNALALNPKEWTIRPKEQFSADKIRMGQREQLSDLDVLKINALYKFNKPGPCPTGDGWRQLKNRCYYFSFITGEPYARYFQARNNCQFKHNAFLAKIDNEIRIELQKIMSENRDKFPGARRMWVDGYKTLLTTSNERTEMVGRSWPFVCSKPYAPVQTDNYVQTSQFS